MKSLFRKKDLILITMILISAIIMYTANGFSHSAAGDRAENRVEISVDGRTVALLDLKMDTEYTVSGYNGGTNHVVIQNGEVWVDEASCPDKICVHQGHVSRPGHMIVCLPNRVVVEIVDGN